MEGHCKRKKREKGNFGKGMKGAGKLGEEPVGKLPFHLSAPTIAAQFVSFYLQ